MVRDADGVIRAWGSVHDRAGGRMLFVHIVSSATLPERIGRACSDVLVEWAVGQAQRGRRRAGARGPADRHRRVRRRRAPAPVAGRVRLHQVRTWWQMSRPVTRRGGRSWCPTGAGGRPTACRFRLVRRAGDGLPDEDDLRDVHDVLEGAFVDHFNSWEETFEEFLSPAARGPRPPLGPLVAGRADRRRPERSRWARWSAPSPRARPARRLLRVLHRRLRGRPRSRCGQGPAAHDHRRRRAPRPGPRGPRGRRRLLHRRGRALRSMGWKTKYVTESWHRDVPVA